MNEMISFSTFDTSVAVVTLLFVNVVLFVDLLKDTKFKLSIFYKLQVYFGKTKEMVCTLRPPAELVQMRLPDS